MIRRVAIGVRGTVQGVGFRPFVWRLAASRGLAGWVRNGGGSVRIEVEGEAHAVEDFVRALRGTPPAAARLDAITVDETVPCGETLFRIAASAAGEPAQPAIPTDLATCAACRDEVATPGARRYRYPFTNCTACGPRFTLVAALPYDRARTSMARFAMCPECAAEYADPADRRFHAEPIACPRCGPALAWLDATGAELQRGEPALAAAVEALGRSAIVALHGLGGFQLLTDATDAFAVRLLRDRKRRPHKPFAVLLADAAAVRRHCRLSAEEERLLAGPRAPILLLPRHPGPSRIVAEVAPDNPFLGCMLPPTPLHALLCAGVDRPLVCTSGNLAEEPICIDPGEAVEQLAGIADAYLVHDRPVLRPVDDSVGRVGAAGLTLLRRARGWVPDAVRLPAPGPTVLAVGGHLKCTVALALGDRVVLSPHLGDLDSGRGRDRHARTVHELVDFFAARPAVVACDLHPDYASTRLAEQLAEEWDVPLERVQHHHAHVAACAAEHRIETPVLGLAWDGSGFGPDGTVWGGEALIAAGGDFRRIAHLRCFPLPGGERAVREPRRAALGLVHEIGVDAPPLDALFAPNEIAGLRRAIDRRINSPRTSSIGRLFDGVAALAGLGGVATFEGQAAMRLEFAAAAAGEAPAYPLPLGGGEPAVADWEPLLRAVLADRWRGVAPGEIAARFHAALVGLGVEMARRAGLPRVVLSGGCFQNGLLQDALRDRLRRAGFEVFVHHAVPPNDGGLALGQAAVAAARRAGGEVATGASGRTAAAGAGVRAAAAVAGR